MKQSKRRRLTQETFLERSRKVHGNLYDYSETVVYSSEKKVTIRCREHGIFAQTPTAHYRLKQGCPACGRTRKTQCVPYSKGRFVELAEQEHGDKFDYSNTLYVLSRSKVDIRCRRCGNTFSITPNNHLRGKGCRHCNLSGFTKGKPAKVYVLESDMIVKVGITNRSPRTRANDVARSSGRVFAVAAVFDVPGDEALAIEARVLEQFRKDHKMPSEKFNGYTECFVGLEGKKVVDFIAAIV